MVINPSLVILLSKQLKQPQEELSLIFCLTMCTKINRGVHGAKRASRIEMPIAF